MTLLSEDPVVEVVFEAAQLAAAYEAEVVSKRAPTQEELATLDFAWRIGKHGFDMRLSLYVPKLIEANIKTVLEGLLARGGRRLGRAWRLGRRGG